MALTARAKNTLVDKLNTCFAKLGTSNGTGMPKSSSNAEPLAWELWCAHHILTLANKRKEKAEQAAVKAGVIPDKERDPQPAGTKSVIYNGEVVSIGLEVRQPSTRVSTDKLLNYLADHGVHQELLERAVESATSTTRPAHVFTTMLITNEASAK
jgi:hypothetical protein